MLDGGEDPSYIARRLTRFAAEDIGMADPHALTQTLAAWDTYDRLGSPEGELAIAQAVIHLGTAPKSNAGYVAFGAAKRSAKENGSLMPPMHILNAPTKLMKELGYGSGYEYDHDAEDGFSGQNYFPDGMAREEFYQPVERGFEREIVSAWSTGRSCGRRNGIVGRSSVISVRPPAQPQSLDKRSSRTAFICMMAAQTTARDAARNAEAQLRGLAIAHDACSRP